MTKKCARIYSRKLSRRTGCEPKSQLQEREFTALPLQFGSLNKVTTSIFLIRWV